MIFAVAEFVVVETLPKAKFHHQRVFFVPTVTCFSFWKKEQFPSHRHRDRSHFGGLAWRLVSCDASEKNQRSRVL